MQIHKIKHAKTGLYSTGGNYPRWTKVGKIWKNIGHVKTHLRQFINDYDGKINHKDVENWIVESLEVREDVIGKAGAKDFIDEMARQKQEELRQREEDRRMREILKKRTLESLTPEQRKALGY